MHYEGNIIRPPSEARSILLQVTRGCSHNRCTFCGAYKGKRFGIKERTTILEDILFASRHYRDRNRLFLCDGDALIIKQEMLIWILEKIKEHLPWIKRVGVYANTKSVKRKSQADLDRLQDLGLGILYLGVESGNDSVLRRVKKGATAQDMVEQGRKVRRSRITLSVTVLLGLAGKELSRAHAMDTGRVLTDMDPNYVGALSIMPIPGTEMYEQEKQGNFHLIAPKDMLRELRLMLQHTDLSSGLFFANHASNYLPIKARLPKDKERAIASIEEALEDRLDLKPEWLRGL